MFNDTTEMRRLNYISTFILATVLISCRTNLITTYYSDDYDKRNDQTLVNISPLGKVKVPGKWIETRENEVSGQHFFVGPDSVQIAIALTPWDAYEFSHNNRDVTRDNFLKRFYEWEADNIRQDAKGQPKIIKESNSYIIWIVKKDLGPDTYVLFGLKGKTAYNLYVKTDRWDELRKIDFLERLFGS